MIITESRDSTIEPAVVASSAHPREIGYYPRTGLFYKIHARPALLSTRCYYTRRTYNTAHVYIHIYIYAASLHTWSWELREDRIGSNRSINNGLPSIGGIISWVSFAEAKLSARNIQRAASKSRPFPLLLRLRPPAGF